MWRSLRRCLSLRMAPHLQISLRQRLLFKMDLDVLTQLGLGIVFEDYSIIAKDIEGKWILKNETSAGKPIYQRYFNYFKNFLIAKCYM